MLFAQLEYQNLYFIAEIARGDVQTQNSAEENNRKNQFAPEKCEQGKAAQAEEFGEAQRHFIRRHKTKGLFAPKCFAIQYGVDAAHEHSKTNGIISSDEKCRERSAHEEHSGVTAYLPDRGKMATAARRNAIDRSAENEQKKHLYDNGEPDDESIYLDIAQAKVHIEGQDDETGNNGQLEAKCRKKFVSIFGAG